VTEPAEPLALVRAALAEVDCWVVGGAVRDRLLGAVDVEDFDLVLAGDVRNAARAVARACGGTAFSLSDEFGAWRVVSRSNSWHADLNPLRAETIVGDLALRDFTINAIAEPLAGGALIDPLGGQADLASGRLRLAAPDALREDPLRAMRLVRLACELSLEPDADARSAAREVAPGLLSVAPERVYAELRRIIASDRAVEGARMLITLGLAAVVLPELDALVGVGQSDFHHLDVGEHTLEVLTETIKLQRDPAARFGDEAGASVAVLLAEPLADEMTRGTGLRFGALLHDIAKPATRRVEPEGRVRFPDHATVGADLARTILGRMKAAERVKAHVAALTLHHLRLGLLVHRRPLSREDLYEYLDTCGPVAADVTLLSVVDRLGTRGARSEEAIASHLELAREVLGEALRWHVQGHPRAPVRGDDLASELGLVPGPQVGGLLAAITKAAFTGEVANRDEAIAYGHRLIA
jgi:poly(A) polymerase